MKTLTNKELLEIQGTDPRYVTRSAGGGRNEGEMMTAQELAGKLTLGEMGEEISDELAQSAKASGLVVVYGASDDLMEFRGAIHDEADVYDGEDVFIDSQGLLPDRDNIDDDEELEKFFIRKRGKLHKIKAISNQGGYSWVFETEIPHVTFEILEDGDTYCRGIVFKLP